MSRQIQIRRGTADENNTFTGAIGEITMDTTNNTLRVHDGQTLGGTALATHGEIQDLGSIPEDKAHQLIGNRIWISNEYNLSASANVVISHNLEITDPKKAIAIPYLKFNSATAGYAVGEEISHFTMTGMYYIISSGIASYCDYHGPLNVEENTVTIPKLINADSVFVYNKNSGTLTRLNISVAKVFVKIIY